MKEISFPKFLQPYQVTDLVRLGKNNDGGYLVSKKDIKVFPKRKINTKNTHGTGCTLSSALATCLSQKKNIYKSCKTSLQYVDQAIKTAPSYGKGFGPLNHLVSLNLKNIDA